MKKVITGVAVIILIVAGIFYFGKNSKQPTPKKTIKIGALLPLSGIASNYGDGSREGIEMAKEELAMKYPNLNLDVIYEDSLYSPKGGVDGYKKLKNLNNVSAILTGASQVSIAVKKLTDKDNVLQMAIWSGAPSYSDTHNLNFRVTMLADDHVPPLLDYMSLKKYNRLAIMYAQNEFGVAFKNSFEKFATASGVKIVDSEGFGSEDMDFKTQLLKIRGVKVDSIFFVGLVKQFANVLKEAKDLGIKTQIFSAWSVEDQQLLDSAKDVAENIIYTYPFDYDTPYSKDFTSKYQQKYNKLPNGYIAESYVGTMLTGEAINACQNKINISCWKNYLNKIKNFPTIMGLATMDSRGDLKAGKIFLKTLKNGKFVKLEE